MTKHVLFIQGAGTGAFEEDKKLAASLRKALGIDYELHYPAMLDEDNAPYQQWKQQIEQELAAMQGPIILVGHSVGASVIIKCMSETEVKKPIAGIFLIAAPFWGGNGWRYEGYEELALPNGLTAKLPRGVSIFLYHCRDDEIVPSDHLALYAQVLPQAVVREFEAGGHQLNNDLSEVARDIKTLQ
ncbi:MAG: alpha/beta hydrolase [Chitinophagaceae bacterium]|nr:alpha/beta hydrolase [Anaerolineae bacterium]